MKKITLNINGKSVTVDEGTKIIDAAKQAGYNIPTLCYLKGICNEGSCRICVVEVKGARNLVASCSAVVAEGMEVQTNSKKVRLARKTTIELILSNHDKKCLSCVRSGSCELQKLSHEYECDEVKYEGIRNEYPIEDNNAYLVRDNNKCILCRRCVAVCKSIQAVGVIGANKRGFDTVIGSAFDKTLAEVPCVACGQCINVCPVGALREKDDVERVVDFINDKTKHVVVAPAPAVRTALAEEFGAPVGTDAEGKMVSALKMLGFDKVFDITMAADLTIMEEGTEFLTRLNDKTAAKPMITSCSPGWIRFIEFYYPELLPNLSSCKSPQGMFGSLIKTFYAERFNIDPKDIAVVTVMPCIAKKSEITRDTEQATEYRDIDAVITTRELARFIKSAGIDFNALEKGEFDNPLGGSSTAGLLFGATGGVMEAALRTVSEVVEKKPLDKLDFKAIRGTKGIKVATLNIGGKDLTVCVASGLTNAKRVMEDIKSGKCNYDFIEIMACPGGCVNGGGQPIQPATVRNAVSVPQLRAKVIYNKDKKSPLRKSHENPVMKVLYDEYFGEPGSHKAHHVLHTSFSKKEKYN